MRPFAQWTICGSLLAACALSGCAMEPVIDERQRAVLGSDDLIGQLSARYAEHSDDPDSRGTGPFAPIKREVRGLPNGVVYQPADLAALGDRKMPLYIYGNGACSDDGASERQHLLEIASHGYLAISLGRIHSGKGTKLTARDWHAHRDRTRYEWMGDAIDWAVEQNARRGGPFENRIDTARIALSGYSCGGVQALRYAADPRIGTFVILHAGVSARETPRNGQTAVKPDVLDAIRVPTLYILGGPADVAYINGMKDYQRLWPDRGVVLQNYTRHAGTFAEPNGGMTARVVVAWLDWQLRGDPEAAKWYLGGNCRLCDYPGWLIEPWRPRD